MKENGRYQVLIEKLNGICEENNLNYTIQHERYPFTMTVNPLPDVNGQMDLLEEAKEDYTSLDASIVFTFTDGDLIYKLSDKFTISDALFNKLKNYFKKLHGMYMMWFFREVTERALAGYNTIFSALDDIEMQEDEELEE